MSKPVKIALMALGGILVAIVGIGLALLLPNGSGDVTPPETPAEAAMPVGVQLPNGAWQTEGELLAPLTLELTLADAEGNPQSTEKTILFPLLQEKRLLSFVWAGSEEELNAKYEAVAATRRARVTYTMGTTSSLQAFGTATDIEPVK